MSFITLTNINGISINVNTDRIMYVVDGSGFQYGCSLFFSGDSRMDVREPYLEVVGMLKSQGGCNGCR